MDIVKTGAKVKDNYYVNTDSGQKKNERVIRIDPAWLIVAGVVIVAAVVLLFLAKRAYDNFYVIRHQMIPDIDNDHGITISQPTSE